MLRDLRAVTPVIGFILLLQILIIFLAFVQTTIVPDQLKKIEADNVKSVKSEIVKFSAMVSSGSDSYLLVKTPEYPDYLFILTPEPAGFSVRTEPLPINVSADVTLPNGSKMRIERTYHSKRIYVSIDNYFYPDTTFILENTAVFQKNNGGTGVAGEQSMVKNGLNLVLILSNMSEAHNSPHEFSFKTISSGGRYYAENITVEFESVNPDYWRQEGFSVSGNVVNVTVSSGTFSVTAISDVEERTVPEYMVKINPFDSYSMRTGESKEFGVLVVDRYMNPVSGFRVNVSVSGGVGQVTPTSLDTDISGIARASFIASSAGSGKIVFSGGSLRAEYSVTVTQPQSGNRSSLIQVSWLNSSGTWDGGVAGLIKPLAVRVTDASGQPLKSIPVSFVVSNTSVVELNTTTSSTNSQGIAHVQAFAKANGSVNIYAFAGDTGDVLNFDVVNITTFWLTGWTYRVPVIIHENSGTQLTDYQVLVVLNTTFNWSAVKSDGSDIRFTDSFGNLLNYWIEEWNYGTAAKIWVKVPSIPASGTATTYLYYGNSAASSSSNGTGTFVFFDDFDDGDVSDWYARYSTISATTWYGRAVLRLQPWLFWFGGNYQHFAVPSNLNLNLERYVVGAYIYDDRPAGSLLFHYVDDGNWWSLELYAPSYDIFRPFTGGVDRGWVYTKTPCSISADTWYKIEVYATPSGFEMYIDDVLRWEKTVESQYSLSGYSKVGFVEHSGYGPLYADYIYVRKYASTEPTVILGSEQKSP